MSGGRADKTAIRDYGLIGDCHGAALVSGDGAVDWCCLGRFDAEPVFCRLLDRDRGGFLSVTPTANCTTTRAYVADTNLLRTICTAASGEAAITDFMPVGRRPGSGTHNYVELVAPKQLVRIVEARQGAIELRIRYRPSLAFGAERPRLQFGANVITAGAGPMLLHDVIGFSLRDDAAEAVVTLRAGQRLMLILAATHVDAQSALAAVERQRAATTAFWREWIAYCRYRGPYAESVKRSLLAIKLLIYAPSGALVAAPTTSLPEEIGGSRNWDYRYCWLRDTAFVLYSLAIAGYGGEARRFSRFLPRVCAATAPNLQIMYGIEGETALHERTINHLRGYAGSRPVRIGNDAFDQRQIDVYGEVLDWALLYKTLGGACDAEWRALLAALADHVADHWREPDQGLWEMRRPAQHHVHGKIMSWVALDRAITLLGGNERWQRERDDIVADVLARGVVDGHLRQTYETQAIDAALLLVPMSGFPLDPRVFRNTVAAVEHALREGDFLNRYRTDDGVAGGEGAFLMCSFWLVDAYLQTGRRAEAEALFTRMLGHANDVGLFSEEIDPRSGAFLGNFPQAYTHLALIGSAAHLQLHAQHGAGALRGTYADRTKRMVTATLGWKALWAVFRATWKVGRILPSRASILELDAA
jgi:alpha,alpha-trehalase